MAIQVTRQGGRWVCSTRFEDRHIPLAAGFHCDANPGPNGYRIWYTTDAAVAARLMDPAAAKLARAADDQKYKLRQEAIEKSIAADADFEVPLNRGCVLRPFQRAGVAGMYRRPKVLLADDPGLGKTVQVAGLINRDETLRRILIACPLSLTINWTRELHIWLVRKYLTVIWPGNRFRPDRCDISILHYDAIWSQRDMLRSVHWDLIVADECHLLKNPAALRTRALLGIDEATAKRENKRNAEKYATYTKIGKYMPKPEEIEPLPAVHGRRETFLTGTPLPNRPREVFPIAHHLDPREFPSRSAFTRQFCDAHGNEFGWDDSGHSNLAALQRSLRSTIMIRRLKRDVLKELPAKQRAVIEIPHGAQQEVAAELQAYVAAETGIQAAREAAAAAKASGAQADYAAAVANLKAARVLRFELISKQRHDTGLATLPYILDHLHSIVDEGEKVVCFLHHRDIIEAVLAEFHGRAVGIYGKVLPAQRQANVDRFQTDPDCMLAVGNWGPMGVGWTLTAASRVVVGELDWVPGNVSQGEDRCHRIGQHDMVLVEHLVLQGSLAAHIATKLVEKQAVQAEALDMEPIEIDLASVQPGQPGAAAGPPEGETDHPAPRRILRPAVQPSLWT